MMRQGTLRLAGLIGVGTLCILTAAAFWFSHIVQVTLTAQAEREAAQWSARLDRHASRIDEIFAGYPATPAQDKALKASLAASGIVQLRLFNRAGRQVYDSAHQAQDIWARMANPHALAVIDSGTQTLVVTRGRNPGGHPTPFVSAALPIPNAAGGAGTEAMGVAILAVDTSTTAATLWRKAGWLSLGGVAALLGMLVIPAGLLTLRAVARQHDEDKAALLDRSRRDDLTGLINRRGLQRALHDMRAAMTPHDKLIALHIDLDKFQTINDTSGPQAGDQVLRAVSEALRRAFGADLCGTIAPSAAQAGLSGGLVPAGGCLARVGGDEFVLCLIQTPVGPTPEAVTNAVQAALAVPVTIDGAEHRLSATLGLATWTPDTGTPLVQVLQDSAIALRAAKRSEHAPVRACTPQLRATRLRDVALAQEARDALVSGGFTAYFQPIFATQAPQGATRLHAIAWDGSAPATDVSGATDPTTGTANPSAPTSGLTSAADVVGFEALLRWHHPEKGLLRPHAFLEACEDQGLSDALAEIVFSEAAHLHHALTRSANGPLPISINVGQAHLQSPDGGDRLLDMMRAHGLRPDDIRLEILETTLMVPGEPAVVRNITTLAEAGYAVDLDDFGTGHSAIPALRHLPVSRLKIDQSLIQGMDRDNRVRALTHGLIDLGQSLGLEVLAEGIERGQEYHLLAQMGCPLYQGDFLHPPVSQDATLAWVDTLQPPVRPTRPAATLAASAAAARPLHEAEPVAFARRGPARSAAPAAESAAAFDTPVRVKQRSH